jgi:hypothetical protein
VNGFGFGLQLLWRIEGSEDGGGRLMLCIGGLFVGGEGDSADDADWVTTDTLK